MSKLYYPFQENKLKKGDITILDANEYYQSRLIKLLSFYLPDEFIWFENLIILTKKIKNKFKQLIHSCKRSKDIEVVIQFPNIGEIINGYIDNMVDNLVGDICSINYMRQLRDFVNLKDSQGSDQRVSYTIVFECESDENDHQSWPLLIDVTSINLTYLMNDYDDLSIYVEKVRYIKVIVKIISFVQEIICDFIGYSCINRMIEYNASSLTMT
jgi:hypothetical protein